MSDEIKNWYAEVKTTGFKKGKDFKNHEIEPCSMIGLIGQGLEFLQQNRTFLFLESFL